MKITSWNVRGAGSAIKRAIIKESIRKFREDIVLLQETKISCMEDRIIRELWGRRFVKFNSLGTSGVILLMWNSHKFSMKESWMGESAVSAIEKTWKSTKNGQSLLPIGRMTRHLGLISGGS